MGLGNWTEDVMNVNRCKKMNSADRALLPEQKTFGTVECCTDIYGATLVYGTGINTGIEEPYQLGMT